MRELLIEWLLNYLLISLVLWQIGFIIHLLLKNHYGKKPKEIYKSIPTAPTAVEVELPNRKKDIGVVDVSVKKHIVAEKPTDFKLDSDETIDGSVKLQKDKLKEHSKMHKGGMRSKHIKNMMKFMKEGDSFTKAHNKAKKLD